MKKRSLRICLLVGLLSVGMLAACSKKDDPPPAVTTDGSVTTEEVTRDVVDEETEPTETAPAETTSAETDPAPETTAEEVTTEEPETYPELNLPTDPAGVVELIDSIPAGTLDAEWDIDRAYAAWAALSESDRALVTNYDQLRALLQEVADAHVVKDYQDRIPHGELLLGAYFGPTPTDENMQTVVDAYLDFLCGVGNNKETLDQYAKYGVGAFVSGGSFGVADYHVGGSWTLEGRQNVDTARAIKSVELMVQAAAELAARDHEAIWGIDYRDEPGAADFWFYDYVLDATNKEYSRIQTFANLLPNYASPEQLGMYGYMRYVRDYANRLNGDILSLDHYIYDQNTKGQITLITGFEDAAEAARDADKDFMVIVQLNMAPNQGRLTTLGEVKFQAYSSMAYGAKYIIWACYNGGWWNMQALDGNQQPTEQYYKMQECNADLKTLSPIFMRYTSVDQAFLNPSTLHEFMSANHPLGAMGIKTVTDLTASESTTDLLVGYYEKNVGEGEAFLFVNTAAFDQNGSNTETSTVSFRTVSPASVVTAYVKGIPTILTPVDGVYTIDIVDADAVFVTVTEPDSLNDEPVAPLKQVTIGGTDLGEFSIVIPADATEREEEAAEILADIIRDATFLTLPVVTDAETPAHGIYLGKTARGTAALSTARAAIKADGYVIMTEGGNLYVSGNDAAGAGTLFGVYAFCEEYLGMAFYADNVIAYHAETAAVPDGVTLTHNPSFTFRDSTSYAAMDQEFALYQKYNGYSVFGDVNFASAQFGGFGLYRLCGVNSGYDTAVVCLSDANVYATALANAKVILNADPHAEYLACDMGLNGEWNVCACDACAAAVAEQGTLGYTLAFANRLAADLKADYPNVKVVITAGGDNLAVPAGVRLADNVAVRVALPTAACRFHALGDANCETNAAVCAALTAWTQICDHVILLDQVTERTDVENPCFSGNVLALYDTVQYLKGLGVAGYQQMGYDTRAGEFESLNAYLLSRVLWDADMTREEYSAEIDGFLQAYYGDAAAPYIRQYIDKIYNTEGLKHSEFKTDSAMIYRTADKSFGQACLQLWYDAIEAAEAAGDAADLMHTEYSSIQINFVAKALRDNTGSKFFRGLLVRYGLAT